MNFREMRKEKSRNIVFIVAFLAIVPSFLYAFIIAFDTDWSQWLPTFNYFVGYETGFGGRKLIGTFFNWLFPGTITPVHIRSFILTANFLMLALLTWFVCKALTQRGAPSLGIALTVVLYAVGPFSLMAYVRTPLSMGFMETYQFVLLLAWLLLYLHRSDGWVYYLVTLLVSVCCILIHHAFCCTMMPAMVALCLMDCFSSNSNIRMKLSGYGAIAVVLVVLFVMLWFLGGMNVDIDTLMASIRERGPEVMPKDKDGFWLLYYASNEQNMQSNIQGLPYKYVEFGISLLILAPLLYMMFYPWMSAAHRAKTLRQRWHYRSVYLTMIVLTLPIFIVATDYSRWWIGLFLGMTVVTLATYAKGDCLITNRLQTMGEYLKRHWWVAAALIIYAAQLCMIDFRGLKQAVELGWMIWPLIT